MRFDLEFKPSLLFGRPLCQLLSRSLKTNLDSA
jgi:hypothetical protein